MSLPSSLKKLVQKENKLAAHCFVNTERLHPAERRFVDRARGQHTMPVHRPSWPDFLVCIDGAFVGVEVKEPGDRISSNQRRTFNLLEDHGIMKIFVWNTAYPDKLIPWKRYKNPLKFRS